MSNFKRLIEGKFKHDRTVVCRYKDDYEVQKYDKVVNTGPFIFN